MQNGGRKSFTYDEIDHQFRIYAKKEFLVHYLEVIQLDLDWRDAKEHEHISGKIG